MLDTRAEVNVITRAAANGFGLLVCTDLLLVLKAVLGDTWVFNGAYEDVKIDVGGVVNYQTLLVLIRASTPLSLEPLSFIMPRLHLSSTTLATSTPGCLVRIMRR
jgi:hypothetical protein